MPSKYPVMADLRADQQPPALHGGAGRRHGIEAADLLQRTGLGADIFERRLGHDAALVPGPVIADLAQDAVELRAVSGGRQPKAGVAARIDVAETVHHRAGPGPRPAVDGGGETDLGQVDRRRLQRQRNIDRGAALVDRKADIEARRHPRADPGHAAPGLSGIADEIADRAGLRIVPVAFEPGPVARRFRALRGAAAAGIGPLQAIKPLLDWLPSRSRKLLPRLVSAAPDDTVELITVGVGLGVGEGVGVGVGVGVGDCACAADMMPTRTTAIATSRASARPVPIFRARESRDEQRMQSIPKRQSAGPKNAQNPINRSDLPPVRAKGQSVSPQAGRRIRIIVVRLPQLARHDDNVSGSRQTLRTPTPAFRPQPGSPRPR